MNEVGIRKYPSRKEYSWYTFFRFFIDTDMYPFPLYFPATRPTFVTSLASAFFIAGSAARALQESFARPAPPTAPKLPHLLRLMATRGFS